MQRTARQLKKNILATAKNVYDGMFPDPAEVRLLEVLGGTTFTLGSVVRNGRTMTLILSHGRLLRSEKFKRVAYDNKSILYMNDIGRVIAIQGHDYASDVVRYFDQEELLERQGLVVQYVRQSQLENDPAAAKSLVSRFIYA